MWQQELPHHLLISEAIYADRQLIYEAIHEGDLAKVVLTVLNIMKGKNLLLPTNVPEKSLNFSEQCRAEGNNAYKKGKHQKALEFYNKALLYAPNNSQALALAYSNRSALLYTMELYKACLKDIEMSLGLDCPYHVIDKLNQRKRNAESHLLKEELAMHLRDKIAERRKMIDFTEFPKNPTVPCASLDLDFIVETGLPKVVAAKQVRVGSVLAYEKAFFSSLDEDLLYMGCYYCQNVNPNLIPCDGCCNVLFCSETCKQKCWDEYHDIECKILVRNYIMPIVQAGIKLKKSFNTWTDFIEASNLLSLDRIQKSDIDQIFNGENKFSVLNFYSKRHFWHGRVYNFSLKFAEIIYGLMEIKTFFPEQSEEKLSAILAFSRVLMYMNLHIPRLNVLSSVTIKNQEIEKLQVTSHGIFPVLGKLPHSCDPNALMVGLNNCMALVAIKPLAAGEAITISYAGHRTDYTPLFRQNILLSRYGISCLCDLCRELPWTTDTKPNEKQMRMYYMVLSKVGHNFTCPDLHRSHKLKQIFNSCLEALASLSDLPFSKEYQDVYQVFRRILLDTQSLYTQNCILGTNE